MTQHVPTAPTPQSPTPSPLGLPFAALIGLAALGLPRVILHDLHVIEELAPLTWLLAIGPVVVWITVTVVKRVPNPFVTNLIIGVLFGAMLVIAHQLLWSYAFAGAPPALGEGRLARVIPRLAAIPGGLFTGALLGAVSGLIAWAIASTRKKKPLPPKG